MCCGAASTSSCRLWRRCDGSERSTEEMAADFVRYSPDIETFDPHLEELKAKIIDFWEKTVSESPTREGTGHAVRGAHAKTLGVVRAEMEILGDAPAPYAQGIYAKPGRHDALIRLSSAANHLGPDALLGPVLGFAIKIFDIDGTKLVDDVRPRAEEQPDLHRQHRQALPVHPGDRRPRRRLPGAGEDRIPRPPQRLPDGQGHARAGRLGVGGALRVRQDSDT